MKKLYGCLYAGVEWCFVTDLESRMIRPAKLADFVAAYARHPSAWHNSLYVPGCGHRIAGRCVPGSSEFEAPLGYHASVHWTEVPFWLRVQRLHPRDRIRDGSVPLVF